LMMLIVMAKWTFKTLCLWHLLVGSNTDELSVDWQRKLAVSWDNMGLTVWSVLQFTSDKCHRHVNMRNSFRQEKGIRTEKDINTFPSSVLKHIKNRVKHQVKCCLLRWH
jgi:hypothetical protein